MSNSEPIFDVSREIDQLSLALACLTGLLGIDPSEIRGFGLTNREKSEEVGMANLEKFARKLTSARFTLIESVDEMARQIKTKLNQNNGS